ncbi:ATP cone domain-containing protein [Candidatus Pacearchaeota archaeon]|jgi:anaerobic ribonucleoside-triphosphate reductase|nr:ATP cone domain-containing protein [Candidatus Pacearchaeota archaeon]
MTLEVDLKLPKVAKKRDGNLVNFDSEKIKHAIGKAFDSIGQKNPEAIERCTEITLEKLSGNGNMPDVDYINSRAIESIRESGFPLVADAFESYAEKRKKVRILGESGSKSSTDSFLMVSSQTEDITSGWDRERIVYSLIDEANVDLNTAKGVAKNVENEIVLSKVNLVTTGMIREFANVELRKLGFHEAAERYRNFIIPKGDLEKIIGEKNGENSNIKTNNPEAVNFTIAGMIGKEYALTRIFDGEIARAHSDAAIHLHDLDLPTRVYCSAHSLEYLKKFGLELNNLQTASSPAKHTETLTGHLNTFFAAMQAYYAGALGVGYFNVMYAPLIESDLEEKGLERINDRMKELDRIKQEFPSSENGAEEIFSKLERELMGWKQNPISILTEEEIDNFMQQRGQEVIYAASQNAFSRGGQTLFIDFNIHTGVPVYMKDTIAVLPGGKYGIKRDGKTIFLKENKLEEKTKSGYSLMELLDETGKMVMREKLDGEEGNELIQEWFLDENEKPITYGDFDKITKKFAKNLLKVWKKGDKYGQPFAFPKCDLHLDKDTFTDSEQEEILHEACEVASHNGSPYFVFDRDEVSLAACCRLRTKIEDNYFLKHPESMRFCGFQNVTINLPQAAYRAVRNGKKNIEGLLEEIDKTMEIVVRAHIQKKEYIKSLQKPGRPQWQTGRPSLDGQPYINVDKSTYIIGMIGLNEAVQFITGKEIHEMNSEEFSNNALKTIAHMNIQAKKYGEEFGMKFSLEESPAESATRRLSKTDLKRFPESKDVIRGDIAGDKTYYSNSIHPRADAPIDLITRIQLQAKFHPAIDSGAITHAFVGEEKPDAESIYSLIKKTWENTQTAQLVISPEFTICKKCSSTERGLVKKCGNCGNEEKDTMGWLTRVVGYYSDPFKDWNESKGKGGELTARENGNYSMKNSTSEMREVPHLKNPHDGITAISIGKNDCPLCDDVKQVSKYKKIAEEYGEKFNVVSYEANTEDGLVQAMLGDVNLSQLPVLIILDKNSNVIYRGETKGRNGTTIPINLKEAESAIKNYLEK